MSSSLENAAGEAADAAAALLRPDKLLQSYFADRWNILDATVRDPCRRAGGVAHGDTPRLLAGSDAR